MFPSRRIFLGVAASMTAAAVADAAQVRVPQGNNQQQTNPLSVPDPRIRPDPNQPFPAPRPDPRAILKANQEEIKKDIARLSELTSELQKGLDDNSTTDVLSLDVIHKTEEIEKLAKKIRGLVRG